MSKPQDALYYIEGDIPAEWVEELDDSLGLETLDGVWEIMPDRSEPCDPIMSKVGISAFKRTFLRSYKSRNELRVVKDENGGPTTVFMRTSLPMGVVKEGTIPIDGGEVQQLDSDTKVIWVNESLYSNGRLYQKRVSSLGVMYDVRCVMKKDPQGKCDSCPMFLFRWTFIPAKTDTKLVVNRWMKKIK